ncbi:unnamed protein product [Clonostachys chloroleuca]|uniref:Uncharacterized protein n=1 Tax=Clonostachys chloroleuca TaxID=1926264 RepID=A0AA35LRF6_9HYPO|nr:unnamed protein product [Clonostachys chloroleuca]
MQHRVFLSLALCLLAVDTASAKTCRHRTKTTTPASAVSSTETPATPISSVSVSSASFDSTPSASATPSDATPSIASTPSSFTPSSSAVGATDTPSSYSTPSSTAEPSSTIEPSSTAESSSTPTPLSTLEPSSTIGTSSTPTPSSATTFSTSTVLSSSSSSSSAAPSPTAITPFQLYAASTGQYVQVPAAANSYLTYQSGGSTSTFVIDEATGYLRLNGGAFVCAGYAYSYQTGLVLCTTTPPTTASNRRYVSCVQSLTNHAVTCTVPIVSCTPGGCSTQPGQYDQFSIDSQTTGNVVFLSSSGTTRANVVPRPVTAVEPVPT